MFSKLCVKPHGATCQKSVPLRLHLSWAAPSSHSHNSPDVRLAYIKLVFKDAACKACLHVHGCAVPKVGKPYQRHGTPMLQKQAVWSPFASGKQFTSACVVIGTACGRCGVGGNQGRGGCHPPLPTPYVERPGCSCWPIAPPPPPTPMQCRHTSKNKFYQGRGTSTEPTAKNTSV